MIRSWILGGAAALALAGAAQATTVADPTGDFIATYTGPHQDDLDVTSFSVTYNNAMSAFLIQSAMAGTIDPLLGGFYAIGVNTGTGPASFASIGRPDVKFNQVISVRKDGSASIGANTLPGGSVTITDNAFAVIVPLSLLPTTGFDALQYGFNIWPRSSTTPGTAVISDFAPENATISVAGSAVPEPASWAMMALGFGACGLALRTRRNQPELSRAI